MDVIQERDANNYVTAQIVRDGNISGILSRTTATGATFYGYDGNGNVTLLTDASGTDVAHYRYDAFGNTLEAVGPRASENPYRFSTKELHAASGLYDYGLRFYSPSMGRWINRDPLGEEGGVNLYGFVGNNPVNSVDIYGLDALYLVGRNKNEPSFFLDHALHYAAEYEKQTGKNAYVVEVRSYDDITSALQHYKDIDHLEYVGHGGPGKLYVSDTSVTTTQIGNLPTGNVQAGADICVTACQSADTEKGSGSVSLAFAKRFKTKVVGYKGGVSFGPNIFDKAIKLADKVSVVPTIGLDGPHYVRSGIFQHRGLGRMTISPDGGMRTGHPGVRLYGQSASGR